MKYLHEMRDAIYQARMVLNNADEVARSMGYILEGRLRHLSPDTLKQFKKELQNFNAHTGKWKD